MNAHQRRKARRARERKRARKIRYYDPSKIRITVGGVELIYAPEGGTALQKQARKVTAHLPQPDRAYVYDALVRDLPIPFDDPGLV